MLIAGMDIGSTNCKVVLYDTEGNLWQKFSRPCPLQRHDGYQELDAEDVWQAVAGCLADAFASCRDIGAIAVTSFGESFVVLDAEDAPLFPITTGRRMVEVV